MSLANVHPKVLERITRQLPPEAKVINAMAIAKETAVFMVEYKGVVRRMTLGKGSLTQFFANRAPEVEASEGESFEEVLRRFSDKYKLFLLEGVDYTAPNRNVQFEEKLHLQHLLELSFDGVNLYGSITLSIKNKEHTHATKPLNKVCLKFQKAQLALASKILHVEGKVFVGDQLSNEFSSRVVEQLNNCKTPIEVSVENVGTAKVLDDLHDGVSRVVIFETMDKTQLVARYRATEDDRPTFREIEPPTPTVEEETSPEGSESPTEPQVE